MGRLRFTPGTRQMTITHGDVTFTFSTPVSAGNFVDGPAWVVVPNGTVMLQEPTPAQTTYDGGLANGCMVNPVVGQQAYDHRMQFNSFNASLVADTWPRAIQAGDVIVKGVSREVLNPTARAGVCDSYGALFVLRGPPTPGSFAPAAVGWTGRGAPKPIMLETSIADFVASLPVYDMSSVASKPPYDKIMEMFDTWCPAGQRLDLIYESLFPWGMGFSPTPTNYGRDAGSLFQAAALSLLRDDFTTEQKRAIATRLVSWGIQFSDPSVGSGTKYTTDGGHFQFHQSAVLLYLHLRNQADRIANFLSEQGGNFNQAFRITAENVAQDFVRHTDPLKPCTYRERLVVSSSGTSLTFEATRLPGSGGGDTANLNVTNLVVKRASDGASAYITAVGSVSVAASTTTNLTVTIDAQPDPPFAPGDVIWFEPPAGAEPEVGEVDWRLTSEINTYNPSWNATYRHLNYWSGHVMFLDAIGLIDAAGLGVVRDWVIRANKLNTPLPTFDYRSLHKSFVDRDLNIWNFDRDFWNAHWAGIYFDPLAEFVYSEAVTSTASLTAAGEVERVVTAPAHLAAYTGSGAGAGRYRFSPDAAKAAPVVLYPGEIAMSQPDPGGSISLVHAPWAVFTVEPTFTYRVMVGDTVLATSLPFSTAGRSPGETLRVLADIPGTDASVLVGEFTLEENPLGPVLSGFQLEYETPAIRFSSDMAADGRWRRYPPGHVFVNEAQEVWDGTGAIDGGTIAIPSGPGTASISPAGGISGEQELRIVGRVGAGPLSNVIGGPINITIASGVLTSPQYRSSTIGGDGAGAGVTSATFALPVYSVGDIVQLPVGIDCAANLVAGLTLTVDGETIIEKQALTDNGVTGDSGQSVALYYFRAAAANPDGTTTLTIAIAAGGTKTAEQIICAPSVRFDAKEAGDPYGQVLKTSQETATLSISTRELTPVSSQSRIEAFLVTEFELPTADPPATWTLRQRARLGPQSGQLLSRNAATTAGEVVEALTLPLPVARRGVGLTWELLPKGA